MRLRIGTRGSKLALAQSDEVAGLLRARGAETEIVPIVTSGDRGASPARSPTGTKGLFVAEITDALARGEVDLAVHSAKDLPSEDPPGIVVTAVPERRVPYDVLVTRSGELAPGAVVGTASLRRRAQLLRARPRVTVVDVRGNVDSRLRRLAEGRFDALVLAAAGLARLGLDPPNVSPIEVEQMVPAPGQGALAVQAREDADATALVRAIDHAPSHAAFEAERRVASLVGGGCRLPLGAYAERRDGTVRVLAVVVRPDGSDLLWAQVEGPTPEQAAEAAASSLLDEGAGRILDAVRDV